MNVPAVRWYLADLIMEIVIAASPQNVVHINTILIRAESADHAYAKALAYGAESQLTYTNTEGNLVTIQFRGLRDMNEIMDTLEDGAELMFEERTGLTDAEIVRLITPKEHLTIFAAGTPTEGSTPNYLPAAVAEELSERLRRQP